MSTLMLKLLSKGMISCQVWIQKKRWEQTVKKLESYQCTLQWNLPRTLKVRS